MVADWRRTVKIAVITCITTILIALALSTFVSANPGAIYYPPSATWLFLVYSFFLFVVNAPLNLFMYFIILWVISLFQNKTFYVNKTTRYLSAALSVVLLGTLIGVIIDSAVLATIYIFNRYLLVKIGLLILGLIGVFTSFVLLTHYIQKIHWLGAIVVGWGITAINLASWTILFFMPDSQPYFSDLIIMSIPLFFILSIIIMVLFGEWYYHRYNKAIQEGHPFDAQFKISKREGCWIVAITVASLLIISSARIIEIETRPAPLPYDWYKTGDWSIRCNINSSCEITIKTFPESHYSRPDNIYMTIYHDEIRIASFTFPIVDNSSVQMKTLFMNATYNISASYIDSNPDTIYFASGDKIQIEGLKPSTNYKINLSFASTGESIIMGPSTFTTPP